MNDEEILRTSIKERNVKFLTKWYFDIDLTRLQEQLVRKIVFEQYRKFSVSAMTRWGKSLSIAIAVGLYLILNENKKVFFISPTSEQSMILRDYLADLIEKCQSLKEICKYVPDDMTARSSRAFQTFTNKNEYRVFTAHDSGDNLLGHGLGSNGGILVIDEATKISDEAYTKIMRMLGDNPDKTILVELFNPWTRTCRAFEHSINTDYHRVRIGFEEAIKDKRTTREFIESQRKELTRLEFQILYLSEFPEQSEDSVFDLNRINESIDKPNFGSNTRIISCDVADKGLDKTVILVGKKDRHTNRFLIENIYSESMSENVQVAGRINDLIRESLSFENIIVNIDSIGVGTGVVSMVREFVSSHEKLGKVKVNACHFGEKPIIQPERFLNKKSENYFRLKEIFEAGLMGIPDNKDLINQLISIKWKFNATSKIVIVDPTKSPDFADALVYFIWFIQEYTGGYLAR